MSKDISQKISVSGEPGVSVPALGESAIGVWDVLISAKYRCEKCGENVVSLVLWDGYIEYLEYPLLCRFCDSPRDFASAVKTLAEKVKDSNEFYRLVEKLLQFVSKEEVKNE